MNWQRSISEIEQREDEQFRRQQGFAYINALNADDKAQAYEDVEADAQEDDYADRD